MFLLWGISCIFHVPYYTQEPLYIWYITWSIKRPISQTTWPFVQKSIQAYNKETIKALYYITSPLYKSSAITRKSYIPLSGSSAMCSTSQLPIIIIYNESGICHIIAPLCIINLLKWVVCYLIIQISNKRIPRNLISVCDIGFQSTFAGQSPKRHCIIQYIPYNRHYADVIMSTMASQVTSLTIVYSIVYWDADQRKHQSFASLAFVWWIHRSPVHSPHKWPVTRKMFLFDDIIM